MVAAPPPSPPWRTPAGRLQIKHMQNKISLAKKLAQLSLGLAACAAVTVTAYAVTFDADILKGFVGKGDVQLALGYNNATLQANAENLVFTYEVGAEYDILCSRIHSVHGYQTQPFRNQIVSVNKAITVESRKNNQGQVTGFILDGLKKVLSSGDACPTGWPNEVSRTLNPNAGQIVGLFVDDGVDRVKLWPLD
jgi:hypothetical protein